MIVRMIHPQHGAMHVYSEDDKKKHEGLGWSVEVEPKAVPALDFHDAPKKRGRPAKVS